jgi:monofunctional biosynthetic peptidoglycan transglycosylase
MKKFMGVLFRIIKYFVIIYLISSLFFVVLYRFVNPPVTPLMVIRVTEQFFSSEPVKLKKEWMPLDDISPSMQLAVVAAEDNKFTEHWGFDFDAINKAKIYNEKKKGKRVRGASTISQQTAKNVFLWPQRSWIRKGLEVYFTTLIEIVWGKKRIMEVYLNVIETGNGIYGVSEAARIYFNRPPSKLTKGQAALIAAVLPNPRKWNPSSPSSYLLNRQQWILWNMGNIGSIEY